MTRIHITSIEDAPSFTTTPSKIAMEHQAEVRDRVQEAVVAAGYNFAAAVAECAEAYRKTAGEASAQKRGRNPVYPYVPIILHPNMQVPAAAPRQEQILGRAYVTREEAISCAAKVIDARVAHFIRQLHQRGARALREQYGLPRELPMVTQ